MKKFLVVLVVLFIGILFAGCTSQTTTPTTPTETTVATTVATAVPTEVPTTVATANVTPNVTATAVPTTVATPVPEKIITFKDSLTVTPTGTIYIPVGTKIVFYNADPLKPHGIQPIGIMSQSVIKTVNIPYKGFYNVTFDKKGTYNFGTLFQPDTTGLIVVN